MGGTHQHGVVGVHGEAEEGAHEKERQEGVEVYRVVLLGDLGGHLFEYKAEECW